MKIAIGTLNPVKIAAAKAVCQRIWPEALVQGQDVPSGISAQPHGLRSARRGAANRAEAARRLLDAELGIGLEGYTWDDGNECFLSGWVEVVHRDGRRGSGASGSLRLPASLAAELAAGGELGPLMDRLTGRQNTKQEEGSVGILTGGLLARRTAFETALVCALAPFISAQWYGDC